jgi:endonuclease-8
VPEGDTIHRAAARIGAAFAGTIPEEIGTPHPRHRMDRWPERLAGRPLTAVDAHGKHLLLHFGGGLAIHSHLRMTGAWTVVRAGERWRRSPRRAWLVLRGGGWEAVQFDGPVLELLTEQRARTQLSVLGQDVLGARFDEHAFLVRLREADPTRPVGDALLDQRIVAGIGNLWKSEACHACAVNPWRTLADLGDEQALALVAFARRAMREAVRAGVHARPSAVYGHAGRPCPRCGAEILQRGQGDDNRLTYWCAACQR